MTTKILGSIILFLASAIGLIVGMGIVGKIVTKHSPIPALVTVVIEIIIVIALISTVFEWREKRSKQRNN